MLFEEQLLRDGFGKLKVIIVPHCDVLTEAALKKLQEFQKSGGVIIGDEFLVPALMPDWRLSCRKITNGVDDAALVAAEKHAVAGNTPKELSRKSTLQRAGRELAAVLQGYIQPFTSSDNADLITSSRSGGAGDYLFVVNDKRTFGNYVGQWKLVPEKGLANKGKITVHHKAEAAYDLVRHREIPLKHGKNSCSFDIDSAPGDGACILLLEKKIAGITLAVPRQVKTGKAFQLDIVIHSIDNKNIRAYLPVEVEINSNGKKLPGSGYYAAVDGKLTIKEIMPTNLPPGKVNITVRCLASGKTVQKQITLVK
jgi:hypothetical protein